MQMKSMISASLIAVVLWVGNVYATEPTAQQDKMVTCSKDAGDKKGDDRKAFMKECLSAKKMTQQDKMKACSKDALSRSGVEGSRRRRDDRLIS